MKEVPMKSLTRNFFIAFVFTAFILPSVCFAREKPKVRLFLLFDMTGPMSGLTNDLAKGARMYLDYWTKNELVPEIEIVYDIYDSGNNADKARSAMMDAFGKTPKPSLAMGGWSSAIGVVLKPLAIRHRVPILEGSSARSILFPPEWSFTMQPDYPSFLGMMGKWVKDNWKSDSKIEWITQHYEKRNPRIAVMGWDNAFGRSFRTKETDEYFQEIGVDFVGEEYVPYAPKDTTPNLRRLRSKGVDFIYLPLYSEAHAVILKDAKRLGMRDDFMDVTLLSDLNLIKKHGGEEIVKNTIILTQYQLILEKNPEFVQKWVREDLKLGDDATLLNYFSYITMLDLWREVLQRAVKKFGAEKVDSEACYDIITTEMKDGYTPICSTAKQTFSKYKTFGPDTFDAYMLTNGELKMIDSYIQIPNLSPIEYRGK